MHLAAARLWAADRQPYLAAALFALTARSVPGLGTFAVDRSYRLYVDPAVLERWTVAQTGAVLLHEVGHLLRDSFGRGAAVGAPESPGTARRWNLATDAAINTDLVADAVELPGAGGVLPHHLGGQPGMSAEQLYALAPADAAMPRGIWSGDCGSGVDARPRAWEVASGPAVSVAEAELLRVAVAEAVREHLRRGSVPAGWERWAEQLLAPPKADWRRVLRALVRAGVAQAAGASDYTWSRPSRRASPEVVLPGLRRPVPLVAVVVDTSASMADPLLASALREVQGVLSAVGAQPAATEVLGVDAAVASRSRVRRVGQLALSGGGGTDLRVGLTALERRRPRPQVVVVLTDGDTPWPERSPVGMRVVVGLLDGSRALPGWARGVVIEV